MGSRSYSRHGNGRFRRATLENTFGLSAPTCPQCNRFNPHGVNEPPPENCHACGSPMSSSSKDFHAGDRVTFPGYNGERITGEIISVTGTVATVECGDRTPWTVRLCELEDQDGD